jgi:hypothetical protein
MHREKCTREIISRTAWAKAAFNKKRNLFSEKLDINLWKKLEKYYTWSISIVSCGAETWTFREGDWKYLDSFEMWCWRRMEISWTDRV